MNAWGDSWGSSWGSGWGESVAPVGTGGGGAGIIYKRPHKKVHDEIEEYFSLLGQDEADEIVEEARAQIANPLARDAVVASLHQRAVARVANLLKTERDAEIKRLLDFAQDEDDAEAVILMMEAMH